jgi:ABC-type protease/lipase transport system fused ATPase/permease subunit
VLIECQLGNEILINKAKVLEPMQKRTRSILEELDDLYIERDRRLLIENRAANIIANAVRLLEQIDQEFDAETAEALNRKFLNAIRTKNAGKFSRSVRKTDANP